MKTSTAKFTCRLDLEYRTEEEAERVARSVSMDDAGFIKTRREGRHVLSEATAPSAMSLLHTLEDYLACVSVAERIGREV